MQPEGRSVFFCENFAFSTLYQDSPRSWRIIVAIIWLLAAATQDMTIFFWARVDTKHCHLVLQRVWHLTSSDVEYPHSSLLNYVKDNLVMCPAIVDVTATHRTHFHCGHFASMYLATSVHVQ